MVSKSLIYKTAQKDLYNLFDYIAYELHNPESASALLEEFEKKLQSIMDFPYQYQVIPNTTFEYDKVRKCPLGNYFLVYIVNEDMDRVEIIRILYYRSDLL